MSANNNFIEIYHFINPLGKQCFISEKVISEFASERYEKVSIRFIPFFNFQILNLQLSREQQSHATLDDRNDIYNNAYLASLGFYAAASQGKKRGRKFLMALQERTIIQRQRLSMGLLEKVATDIKLDLEMFQEDIQSECVKKMFVNDQKLSHEMNVESTPTSIVYTNDDTGYLIEDIISKDLLHSVCHNDFVVQNHNNVVPFQPSTFGLQ